MEFAVCILSNMNYGVFIPSSLLMFVPFVVFNLLAAKMLPDNWAPAVIVFLSVVFLGALDIVTSYQVVWVASAADETNAMMKPILGNPLTFTALKMGVDTFSAGIVYAIIMMGTIGKGANSGFVKKAGLIAGMALVMFMMMPPVNNYVVLHMM